MKIIPAAISCLTLALVGCSNDPYPDPGDRKVLYNVIGSGSLKGLDPCQTGDTTSAGMVAQIYDALYEYHYLKRPFELKPCLADGMPQVSDDGLVWTIRMKKGVMFQDDPCFPGGKGREATVHDVIYSFKRLADVRNKPTGWWLVQGKVEGLDEFYAESVEKSAGKAAVDYNRPVAGLQALDDYTLRITLNEPFPQLKYVLAMSYTAAVPHEAVEHYGEDFINHPVGTGPFRLKEWSKRWRLILERNPTYRDDYYPTEGEPGDAEAGLLAAAGRKIPFVDELYLTAVAESQPAWLYFRQGYRDMSGIGKDNWNEAITQEKELTAEFRRRGVRLVKSREVCVYYVGFNMLDEEVGGFGERKRKLRQAMSLAFDTAWRIEHLDNGRSISAHGIIPPGLFGYDENFVNPYKTHDLDRARKLLAEAGYPGGRDAVSGKQLTINYDIGGSNPAARQRARTFQDDMAKIGIKIKVLTNTWPEFLRKAHEGRLQVYGLGWILDYPAPENFLQLFYGPNKSPGPNGTNYQNPDYDKLHEKMKSMQDTPERLAIIKRMVAMITEDCPVIFGTHPVSYSLYHSWVLNAKPHGITGGYLKYRDIDVALRQKRRREWNRPNYVPVAAALVLLFGVGAVLGMVNRGFARGRNGT